MIPDWQPARPEHPEGSTTRWTRNERRETQIESKPSRRRGYQEEQSWHTGGTGPSSALVHTFDDNEARREPVNEQTLIFKGWLEDPPGPVWVVFSRLAMLESSSHRVRGSNQSRIHDFHPPDESIPCKLD
ncbi:hypothetical protein PDE_00268 [Penicillium oxalicum 114-2]|uniref:Uncharacterized protein n=1 Tax=Penicillium oxalicum (strain 114-2 / CGMCC 5302) TaxID=933388 RepID=S7Z4B6_PENO1|nr:hypothetical protein PDE_00268 [Penicillium oxalicum 114-2]